MTPIRVFSLYSGSKGNAFLIDTPCGAVLIDAGKSAKRLCQALSEANVSPDAIQAILITHEHSDHISALPVYLKHHPTPVHAPIGCIKKLEKDETVAACLISHPPIDTIQLGEIVITSFPTPHDSMGSVGYRFQIPMSDGKTFVLGYATDIGYISKDVENGLLGCDAVILESNHDPDMLQCGPYPYDLKCRIASRRGHLSNPDSAVFAARLCATGTKKLMLAHLSQENNTPDTAYDACVCAVGDDGVTICVADPEALTELPLFETAY